MSEFRMMMAPVFETQVHSLGNFSNVMSVNHMNITVSKDDQYIYTNEKKDGHNHEAKKK